MTRAWWSLLSDRGFTLRHGVVFLLLLAAAAVVLRSMGQTLWCRGGEWFVWSGDIWNMHNSQHFVDPYTFTHVLHGVVLYGLMWLALGPVAGPAPRFLAAIALQVGWEVLENTDMVIERYRETTISLNYYGDSVANSLADICACALGYLVAMVVPTAVSVGAFVAIDALLLLWIHDSLLLNVLMLLHPLDVVRSWQLGGRP